MLKIYLLLYNSLQAFGWALSLYMILRGWISSKSFSAAYSSAGDVICFLQKAAVLEIVHGIAGIVRSGFLSALMQWGGRIHFLLGILCQIPEIQEHPSVFITFLAWSISEVIRYSQYALTGIRICPSWLTHLRYTAFIILYPIGVGPGEMWLMYEALPNINSRELYKGFFHHFHFSYHSFVVALLLCYPLLWLKLYLHLFKQRRTKLATLHGKRKD